MRLRSAGANVYVRLYSCGYVAVWYVTMWLFYCMVCDHVTTLLLSYVAMRLCIWPGGLKLCMFTLVISADSCLSVYVQEMPVCLESTACQPDIARGDWKHFANAMVIWTSESVNWERVSKLVTFLMLLRITLKQLCQSQWPPLSLRCSGSRDRLQFKW